MNRRALHGLHMRRFPWMMLKAAIQAHSDLLENGWLGSRPSGMLCIKNPPETSGGTWSGRRDSDSRPPPWQGGALPTELLPQNRVIIPYPARKSKYFLETGAGEETRTHTPGAPDPKSGASAIPPRPHANSTRMALRLPIPKSGRLFIILRRPALVKTATPFEVLFLYVSSRIRVGLTSMPQDAKVYAERAGEGEYAPL